MFKPGILKAGLKVSLFFLLSFLLVGKPLLLSLFLAALGGIAGGFLFAGWQNTELPSLAAPNAESNPQGAKILAKLAKVNQNQPGKRRRKQRPSWFFWKNSRSSQRRH